MGPSRRRPTLTPLECNAFRASTFDVPLRIWPNRSGGRWNLPGVDCTQYTCTDAEGPYAEMLRHEGLRTEAEAATLLVSLWEARVHEAAIADYSTFEKAEAAGFALDALVDDDHERCQIEAQWLKQHGARGVLAPSAALPGSVNLTLFGERVAVRWDAGRKLASQVPVRQIGGRSSAPVGLAARVRHYGDVHSGLEVYQRSSRS